ncbi:hypothetical protein [Streptomyces sp. R08]|uniref:Uncharacterized protein n=1 Tax=Streptomyces sp. R08 TaxID=3238624 RepID=A0AB39MPW1_9ACTN
MDQGVDHRGGVVAEDLAPTPERLARLRRMFHAKTVAGVDNAELAFRTDLSSGLRARDFTTGARLPAIVLLSSQTAPSGRTAAPMSGARHFLDPNGQVTRERVDTLAFNPRHAPADSYLLDNRDLARRTV